MKNKDPRMAGRTSSDGEGEGGMSKLFKEVDLGTFTLYEKYDKILQSMISHKELYNLPEEP